MFRAREHTNDARKICSRKFDSNFSLIDAAGESTLKLFQLDADQDGRQCKIAAMRNRHRNSAISAWARRK
jgi:hypothetical protein